MKGLKELDEEDANDLLDILNEFMMNLSEFMVDKDLDRSKFSHLLSMLFITTLESSTASEEDVLKFFNRLSETVTKMYKDGKLNARLTEEEIKFSEEGDKEEVLNYIKDQKEKLGA